MDEWAGFRWPAQCMALHHCHSGRGGATVSTGRLLFGCWRLSSCIARYHPSAHNFTLSSFGHRVLDTVQKDLHEPTTSLCSSFFCCSPSYGCGRCHRSIASAANELLLFLTAAVAINRSPRSQALATELSYQKKNLFSVGVGYTHTQKNRNIYIYVSIQFSWSFSFQLVWLFSFIPENDDESPARRFGRSWIKKSERLNL